MTSNTNTLGSSLRAFRRRRKWSQQELARQSGISASYLGLLELDARHPEQQRLSQLCTALGLTAEETDDTFLLAGYSPRSEEALEALQSLGKSKQMAAGGRHQETHRGDVNTQGKVSHDAQRKASHDLVDVMIKSIDDFFEG